MAADRAKYCEYEVDQSAELASGAVAHPLRTELETRVNGGR